MNTNWLIRCSLTLLLSTFLFLPLVGCGKSGPPIAPASGKLTLNGEVLPGPAIINFTSAKGFSSSFPVRDDGTFTLRSEFGPGIPPDEYFVSIKPPPPNAAARSRSSQSSDASYIPNKYRKFSTSGFNATVTEDGDGPFNFDMQQ